MLASAERTLLTYDGFQIILPANMLKEKPFVWVQRAGRYYLELGESDVGGLIRIDNLLDGLSDRCGTLREALRRMEERGAAIRAELARKESYNDEIELYREKVEKLDERLGVNKS